MGEKSDFEELAGRIGPTFAKLADTWDESVKLDIDFKGIMRKGEVPSSKEEWEKYAKESMLSNSDKRKARDKWWSILCKEVDKFGQLCKKAQVDFSQEDFDKLLAFAHLGLAASNEFFDAYLYFKSMGKWKGGETNG